MAEEIIKLSKEGIEISYRKYLADTASGLVLYLIGFGIYFWGDFTFINSHRELSTWLSAFLAVILFFLSTAIGGALSGISWIFLGNLTTNLYIYLYSCKFKNSGIWNKVVNRLNYRNYKRYQFEKYSIFFSLTHDNWHSFYHGLSKLYRFSHSSNRKVDLNIEAVVGGVTFFRNMSFIAMTSSIIFFFLGSFSLGIIFNVLFLLIIFFGTCEENYVINNTLQYTWIFLLDKINPEDINGDFNKIQKLLLSEDTK